MFKLLDIVETCLQPNYVQAHVLEVFTQPETMYLIYVIIRIVSIKGSEFRTCYS